MEHISKRFGDFYANKDISLTVNRGEVLTLLGENGAGKSTLMNILIGLYQPTEGKIFLNGKEVRIESPSQAVKLGIGMVHQHFMLVQNFTVLENIVLGVETANMAADILLNGADTATMAVKTFDNGTATINTEICSELGYDYDTVAKAFEPYCTKINTITTAESFGDVQQ